MQNTGTRQHTQAEMHVHKGPYTDTLTQRWVCAHTPLTKLDASDIHTSACSQTQSLFLPQSIGADGRAPPTPGIHTHTSNSQAAVSITDKTNTLRKKRESRREREPKAGNGRLNQDPLLVYSHQVQGGSSPHSPGPPIHFWVSQHSGGGDVPGSLLLVLEEDPQASHKRESVPASSPWKGFPKAPLKR